MEHTFFLWLTIIVAIGALYFFFRG
jgi:hypothetical protein